MSHERCACHGVRQVYARTQGGPTLLDATYYSSADRSAVLDECGIRIQELRMLARMSASAANSTAHDAIAVEATMARLSWSDARQLQQLPKCVDRPMAWVRIKGVLSSLKGPLGTLSWQLHMPAARR